MILAEQWFGTDSYIRNLLGSDGWFFRRAFTSTTLCEVARYGKQNFCPLLPLNKKGSRKQLNPHGAFFYRILLENSFDKNHKVSICEP